MSKLTTPVFVLEEDKLKENLEVIARVKRDAGVDIILAFKGFSMWSTFPLMKQYIDGATASSLDEVRLCFEGFGSKAHTYCVAYRDNEFQEIIEKSDYLTFNSVSQYHRFASKVPNSIKIGLRVNPEWSDVQTNLYNPSNSSSRLGVTLNKLKELPDRVSGLHCHVLCESEASSTITLLDKLEEKFGHFFHQITWINIGGGHLMTKEGYDLSELTQGLKAFKQKHQLNIILEPGSAFAWQTGYLETTILDIVENGDRMTAIIDASFTCHMPDCLEMPYRPEIKEGYAHQIEGGFAYKLGGLSCLAGDYLDEYWFEKPLKIGDTITFLDMMHYTMVKTSTFNGIRHPSIAIKKEGDVKLIRQFDYADFKNRLG